MEFLRARDMAHRRRQEVVRGHAITILLALPGCARVAIMGPSGSETRQALEIGPLLDLGLTADDALEVLMSFIAVGIDDTELRDC